MTTLQMPAPVVVDQADTHEAQEARWDAWKSKGVAADRITRHRMRIAVTAFLIAAVGATIAVVL